MSATRCSLCGRFARWDAPKGWWYCDFDERLLPKPPTQPVELSSRPPAASMLARAAAPAEAREEGPTDG